MAMQGLNEAEINQVHGILEGSLVNLINAMEQRIESRLRLVIREEINRVTRDPREGISLSPELIQSREQQRQSSLMAPSAAHLALAESAGRSEASVQREMLEHERRMAYAAEDQRQLILNGIATREQREQMREEFSRAEARNAEIMRQHRAEEGLDVTRPIAGLDVPGAWEEDIQENHSEIINEIADAMRIPEEILTGDKKEDISRTDLIDLD